MTQPKPRYAPRCTILTPLGQWQVARLKLLARLTLGYQVQSDSPEFEPVTLERLEF